jgi:hypothetical protein
VSDYGRNESIEEMRAITGSAMSERVVAIYYGLGGILFLGATFYWISVGQLGLGQGSRGLLVERDKQPLFFWGIVALFLLIAGYFLRESARYFMG